MKDIYFNSRDDLIELQELYYWTSGSEGIIYRIPNGRRNILMKLFYIPQFNEIFLPLQTIKNKEQKVQILGNMILPNRVQIEGNIFLNDEFIGYLLGEAMNHQDFCFNTFTVFQKLEFFFKK